MTIQRDRRRGWYSTFPHALGRRDDITAAARIVLVIVSDLIGNDDVMHYGQRALCDECGLKSREALNRALRELVKLGLLEVETAAKRTLPGGQIIPEKGTLRERLNRYRLTDTARAIFRKPERADGTETRPSGDSVNGPESRPSEAQTVRKPDRKRSEKPTVNGTETRPNSMALDNLPPPLASEAPPSACNDNNDNDGGGGGGGGGDGKKKTEAVAAIAATQGADARDEIERELEKLGVGAAKKIARLPGITLEVIRWVQAATIEVGLSVGKFVRELNEPDSIAEIVRKIEDARERRDEGRTTKQDAKFFDVLHRSDGDSGRSSLRDAADARQQQQQRMIAGVRDEEAREVRERELRRWAQNLWRVGLSPHERCEILDQVEGAVSPHARQIIGRPSEDANAPLPGAWLMPVAKFLQRRDEELIERGRLLGVQTVAGFDDDGKPRMFMRLRRSDDDASNGSESGNTEFRYTGPINNAAQHAGAR